MTVFTEIESKIKFLLASVKSLTKCEKTLPVTLFGELIVEFRKPAMALTWFRKPPMALKIVMKAAGDMYE